MSTRTSRTLALAALPLLVAGTVVGLAPVAAADAATTTVHVQSPWPGPDREILVHALPGCVAPAGPGTESVSVSTRDVGWDAFMATGWWQALLGGATLYTTSTSIDWRNLDTGATGGGLGHGANGASQSQHFLRTGSGRVAVDVDVQLGLPGGFEFGSLGTRSASTSLEVTVPSCD